MFLATPYPMILHFLTNVNSYCVDLLPYSYTSALVKGTLCRAVREGGKTVVGRGALF